MKGNNKKLIGYALVGILLTLVIVGGMTFAFFRNRISDTRAIDATIKSRTVDTQIFDVDDYLHIYADADNFNAGANIKNITDMTKAKISLRANNVNSEVHKDYYVYLKVDQNSFDYTTDDKSPEMLLNVFGPDTETITLNQEQLESIYGLDAAKTALYNYDSTKTYETYTTANAGYYKIEAWGASGGYGRADNVLNGKGGKGGYTEGIVQLDANETLYLYVGGRGEDAKLNEPAIGGYNGGGQGDWDHSDDEAGGGGGGASDIRYFGKNYTPTSDELVWNSTKGLNSRIMVAAGGGGGLYTTAGGAAGGLNSYRSGDATLAYQTSGYMFGEGENGYYKGGGYGAAGGGGGYYGGGSTKSDNASYVGAGGSSYISGHTGTVAIKKDNVNNPRTVKTEGCDNGTGDRNCGIHYSDLAFESTVMIDGRGYNWTTYATELKQMPNPSGGLYASGDGHYGDGAIKITYCGEKADSCISSEQKLGDLLEAAMKNNGDIEEVLNLVDSNGNSLVDKFIQGDLFGLEYRTVVDKNGKTISGFDITNFRGILPITSNYRISTNDVNTPKEETWRAIVTLVNLPENQRANQNKLLEGNLIITPNPALVQMTDDTTITTNEGVQEVQGDVIPLRDLCVYPEADDDAPDREKYMSIEDCVTRFVYRGQGVNGMYLHNNGRHDTYQNSELEAPDLSLRYAGGNNDVANYVCFGYSDESVCRDSNFVNSAYAYRIIGFFYREVTYTYRYGGSSYERVVPEWNAKLIRNTIFGNRRHDQINWDNLLNADWQNLIETSIIYKDDNVYSSDWNGSFNRKTARSLYDQEFSTGNQTATMFRLMYYSDYAYAAIPYYWRAENSWENALDYYSRAVNTDNVWMFKGSNEWTMRWNSYNPWAWTINTEGNPTIRGRSETWSYRPTFYLKHGTLYRGGTGTATDPYILSYAQSYKSGAGTAANPYIPIDELVY